MVTKWYAIPMFPFPRSYQTDLLLRDDQKRPNLDDPTYSQTLCTVLQVALVDLLQAWGVNTRTVVGHSSGEIAAAYCAGGLNRESALKVAYFRGLVAASVTNSSSPFGSMLAVGMSDGAIMPHIHHIDQGTGRIAVACVNGPTNVTVSGDSVLVANL